MRQSTDKDAFGIISFYPAVSMYMYVCISIYTMGCFGGTWFRSANAVETPFFSPPTSVERKENDSMVKYYGQKFAFKAWDLYGRLGP